MLDNCIIFENVRTSHIVSIDAVHGHDPVSRYTLRFHILARYCLLSFKKTVGSLSQRIRLWTADYNCHIVNLI